MLFAPQKRVMGIEPTYLAWKASVCLLYTSGNTECQLAFQEATRAYIEAGKDLEGKGFEDVYKRQL